MGHEGETGDRKGRGDREETGRREENKRKEDKMGEKEVGKVCGGESLSKKRGGNGDGRR